MSRRGLSLVELLVAMAIVAILAGLLLMGVQASRESVRRLTCAHQLRQIGIAIAHYESAWGAFPPGANAGGYSAHVTLLPFLDQAPLGQLFAAIDQAANPETGNEQARFHPPVLFRCPTDREAFVSGRNGGTNYGLCFGTGVQRYGYNGAFRHITAASDSLPGGVTRPHDVTDGLSNTVFLAELLTANGTGAFLRTNWHTKQRLEGPDELEQFVALCLNREYQVNAAGEPVGNKVSRGRPWTYGDAGVTFYNHILGPNSPSCINGTRVQLGAYSAASLHSGGVNALFGDGHVDFMAQQVDLRVWREVGSIRPGVDEGCTLKENQDDNAPFRSDCRSGGGGPLNSGAAVVESPRERGPCRPDRGRARCIRLLVLCLVPGLTSCGLGKRAKPEAEAPLPIVELPAVDWGRAGSGDRPRVVPELGRALPAGDFVVRIEVNRASAGPPLPRLAIFQIVRSSRSGKTTLASAILKLQDGPSSGPARYEGVCRNRTRKPGAVIIEVLLDRQPLLVRRSAVRPAN